MHVYAAGYAHLTKDVRHDVRIQQAELKKEQQQDSNASTVSTSRTPTRKSPRLYIEDDDEVQEVLPPPKVIHLIDLTSKDGAAETTADVGNLPVPVTSTATARKRGRPRLHQVEIRAEESGTERDDTKRI